MSSIKIVLNKKLSSFAILLSVIILSTIIGLSMHLAFAWSGPSCNPPPGGSCNVDPPITTAGGVIAGNLEVSGDYYFKAGNVTFLQTHLDAANNWKRTLLGSGIFWDATRDVYDASSNEDHSRSALEFINGNILTYTGHAGNISGGSDFTDAQWNAERDFSVDTSGNGWFGGDLTVGGADVAGVNGVIINIGGMAAQGIYLIDDTSSGYPDIYCRRDDGSGSGPPVVSNTLCEFRTGAYFSTSTVYITNDLKARGGISDDGGDLDLNDNVNITGNLNVAGTITGGGGGIVWRSAPASITTLTNAFDTTWRYIDITGLIGANATAVILSCETWSTQPDHEIKIKFEKYGMYTTAASWQNICRAGGQGSIGSSASQIIQELDSSRRMRYNMAKHIYANYTLKVIGWIE